MKPKFSLQIFGKCSNIKFYKNPTSWSRGADGRTGRQMDGQTDGQK